MQYRLTFIKFMCYLLLILLPHSNALGQAKWSGSLLAKVNAAKLQPGVVTIELSAVRESKGKTQDVPNVVDERAARFQLVPYRFNLFTDTTIDLESERASPTSFKVSIPQLESGWYLLVTTVADDDGNPTPAATTDKTKKNLVHRQVLPLFGVSGKSDGAFVKLHTEWSRCVFSPGEHLRLFLSVRNRQASRESIRFGLIPRYESEKPLLLGTAEFDLAAGVPETQAFDITADQSARIMPGDYDLVALKGRDIVDRYRIRFVTPARPSGGGRWSHTMPFGTSSGFDGSAALPEKLQGNRYQGMIDRVLKRIHHANLWVNFYGNSFPLVGPDSALPMADHPELPPPAAYRRPALTHAFFQALMSEGISLGICAGYGEDYRSEVYMPLPTTIRRQIDVLARKYLTSGMGAAHHPHFVALYTDYYGTMEYMGGGELSSDELREVRQTLWKQATAAAGMKSAQQPLKYEFDRKKQPADLREHFKNRDTAKAWDNAIKAEKTAAGGHRDWIKQTFPANEDKQLLWDRLWKAAGVAPVPNVPRYVPLPTLDEANAKAFGPQAAYDYASHNLRGVQRCYGTITKTVEAELPAVYTIHNKGTMNHSSVSHAWSGFRTPNVDPAYLADGASAISVSEWNLDAVPKPYFLTTFYNRFLIDRGHPVYRCGQWKQMGSPSRFMRDAVFWGGRQIQTYFDQAGNMTWSQKGADQTTYASNERLSSVCEFLTIYSDMFPRLEPVREVGLYIPPKGGPWGTGVTRGHYVAMLAALMSDHQVHFVSHGDIPEGKLSRYPILFAPSLHDGEFVPFEEQGFHDFINAGGRIVGSQAPDYYHPPEVYTPHGISVKKVPEIDSNTGQPRRNKDGSLREKDEWTGTRQQWANVCREHVWGKFKTGVSVAPIDVHKNFTHLDQSGQEAKWSGSHWTGHHKWAGYRGAALHQYRDLKATFDAIAPPLVIKDQPEVFVNVCQPNDGAQGRFLFASNWTLPDQTDLYDYRVPQGFFNSSVKPVACTLKVKEAGVGAIYDLIDGREVPFERQAGRVVFQAPLDSTEGRIFALYPERVAGAELRLPETLQAGSPLAAQWILNNAEGKPMSVATNVRLRLFDDQGRLLVDCYRMVGKDGRLPGITIPAASSGSLVLAVNDMVTGFVAGTRVAVSVERAKATEADPVTVYRGDQIGRWLKQASKIAIMIDHGTLDVSDEGVTLAAENEHAALEKEWAEQIQAALSAAGVQVEILPNDRLVTRHLYAHPWTGSMAGYRTRSTTPNHGVDRPVLIVGHPERNQYLRQVQRACISGRSLDTGNTGSGRAVIAWAPKAFSHEQDAVYVAASDAAGIVAAARTMKELASGADTQDAYYAAREQMRAKWLPAEVALHKRRRDLYPPSERRGPVTDNLPRVVAARANNQITNSLLRQTPLGETLGTAIFALDASAGGVAVGTKSWTKPAGLVTPSGEVVGFWGGGAEVTPRDVGVSADGQTLAAGFSLMGRSVGIRAGGERLWSHRSGISHKPNPFQWDSFKDSDRHLSVSPDHSLFIAMAGTDGIVAYDAVTGKPRWKIPGAGDHNDPNLPRGPAMPEAAFSPDGSCVLLAPLTDDGVHEVSFRITKFAINPDSGKVDKKKPTETTVKVRARGYRRELMLVETKTGKPRWRRTTAYHLVDEKTGKPVWAFNKELEYHEQVNGRWYRWVGKPDDAPQQLVGQRLAVPFWHLYSTVGSMGQWCILGTRDSSFALLGPDGKLLRSWSSQQLPPSLNPGAQIPASYVSGSDPAKMLAFASQSPSIILFDLHIGTPQQLAAAGERETQDRATMDRITSELRDRKRYREYGNAEYLKAFGDELSIPADLKRELLDRMKQIPSESRAGRKRDYRFFQPIVDRIKARQLRDSKATLDAAAGVQPIREVDAGAMVCDAEADGPLRTVVAGCWDQSVKAFDLATGKLRWNTPVIGGCQIALVNNPDGTIEAIYAGGSRGDLYRLNPATGQILWHRNITTETNKLTMSEDRKEPK